MYRMTRTLLVVALLIAVGGCATFGEPLPPQPTLAEIVAASKAGESPQQIIERMQKSRAVYRLPASELAKLRDQGVADQVIDYMQRVHLDVIRFEESLRTRSFYGPWGPAWGWRDPFWPYGRY